MTQQQPPRRQFLRAVAGAAGATAAMTSFPPAIARALSIKAAVRTGTLQDVEHIVILTQENRSLRPLLRHAERRARLRRSVPGAGGPARPTCRAARSGSGPAVNERRAGAIAPFPLNTRAELRPRARSGTPHAWTRRAGRLGPRPHEPLAAGSSRTIRWATTSEAEPPFQFALANAFTLCDAYHCATQTGTNTNRLFLWTRHQRSAAPGRRPVHRQQPRQVQPGSSSTDYRWTTYPERLRGGRRQLAGLPEHGGQLHATTRWPASGTSATPGTTRPGLLAGAASDRGVSTRDLDLLTRRRAGQHRCRRSSWIVATAERFRASGPVEPRVAGRPTTPREVLDALTANPDVWAKTVLFINFDENDGFFDHVPPPAAPSYVDLQREPGAGPDRRRVDRRHHGRVPPDAQRRVGRTHAAPSLRHWARACRCTWCRRGARAAGSTRRCSDHTSVLRFIEARFGVKETSISPWRRAVSGGPDLVLQLRRIRRTASSSRSCCRPWRLPARPRAAQHDDAGDSRRRCSCRRSTPACVRRVRCRMTSSHQRADAGRRPGGWGVDRWSRSRTPAAPPPCSMSTTARGWARSATLHGRSRQAAHRQLRAAACRRLRPVDPRPQRLPPPYRRQCTARGRGGSSPIRMSSRSPRRPAA